MSVYSSGYVGRFAPSPTGELHFGSLVAAVASFADARHHGGDWILRIDDIDTPRVVHGSADAIIHTLARFGFEWAGAIRWQSQRVSTYQQKISDLIDKDLAYPCRCSRRDIELISEAGREGAIYPGTCRTWNGVGSGQRAIRLRTDSSDVHFEDRVCGALKQNVEKEVGDFVIRRADTLTAYQLAVVVDDHLDGITHVVRGADLLHSTPRQILLGRLLGYATPTFAHLPLVRDAHGEKISKSDSAAPIRAQDPISALQSAWQFLGQPSLDDDLSSAADFWTAATATWSISALMASNLHTHQRPISARPTFEKND